MYRWERAELHERILQEVNQHVHRNSAILGHSALLETLLKVLLVVQAMYKCERAELHERILQEVRCNPNSQ